MRCRLWRTLPQAVSTSADDAFCWLGECEGSLHASLLRTTLVLMNYEPNITHKFYHILVHEILLMSYVQLTYTHTDIYIY